MNGNSVLLIICCALLGSCGASPEKIVQRGNAFFDHGKFDDAAIQYQRALQESPKFGEAHYRLGLTEIRRNHVVEAYRQLQAASSLMPDNTDAASKLGQIALSIYSTDPQHPQQLYQQAVKSADQLLKRHPAGFDGNLLRGQLSLIDKKPADAAGYFRKAILAKPADKEAKLGLAGALAEDNQTSAGLELARELIQSDKTFGPAYDFLFQQYWASGKAEDAESSLKLKVSNNPGNAAFILELARFYAARQKPPEVASALQKLLDNPKAFPSGRMMVGDFYASAGRPDDALRNYEQGLQANPKNPVAWRQRIFAILSAQHKWPEALAQVNAILREKPNDQDAKRARALAWLDEGKPENLDPAIAELRAQLKTKTQDPALHFQLGNALARKGDQDAAAREWSVAAQQNRTYLPPRFAMVEMDLRRGSVQAALPIADQIIAVAPKDPQARLTHAVVLTSAGEYQRARAELNALAAEYPQSAQIRFRLGVLAISEKKFGEAESIFRQLQAATKGDPAVLAGLAQAYQGQNESAKAIQLLQDEIKGNPNSLQLRSMLASLAAASGQPGLAIEQYKLMAAASPGSLEIQRALAAAYVAGGDAGSAVNVLEKAVQSQPKSVPANLDLAHALISANRINEAKARYRKVVELDPKNPGALNDLAYLMADTGDDPAKALAMAQRGMQYATEPRLRSSLSDTVGWIYLKQNMEDAALQTFRTLVRSNPDNSTFRLHLGTALYQKGDKKQARAELEAALADKPTSSDATAIRALLAKL